MTKSAFTKRVQNGPSTWYDRDVVEMVAKSKDIYMILFFLTHFKFDIGH